VASRVVRYHLPRRSYWGGVHVLGCAQQGRPTGWCPSSFREVPHRPLYRGEIVWNRTRNRNTWGQKQQHARPDGEGVRVPAPACASSRTRLRRPPMGSIVWPTHSFGVERLRDRPRRTRSPESRVRRCNRSWGRGDWELVAEHAIQMAAAGTLITLPGTGDPRQNWIDGPVLG
jgi:hypothetical protein